ncbi:MAG: HD domain-containing protein [Bdellovibrionales bacterium]|nr:HD domain-containing protein [Bdellovibrionales bacterium]
MKLGLTILLLVGLLPQLSYGGIPSVRSDFKNSKIRSKACNVLFAGDPIIIDLFTPGLTFTDIYYKLSTKPRSGAISIGISEQQALRMESIYDHITKLKAGIVAFAVNHKNLNLRIMKDLALVHDIAEFVVPDFTPNDRIDKNTKHRMEKHVFRKLKKKFGKEGRYLYKLWLDYEYARTPEAKLVKDLDKADAAIQALRYKKFTPKYYEFYGNAMAQIKSAEVQKILTYLYSEAYSRVASDQRISIGPYKMALELYRNNGDVRMSLKNLIKDSNTLKEILSYHEKEYLELL